MFPGDIYAGEAGKCNAPSTTIWKRCWDNLPSSSRPRACTGFRRLTIAKTHQESTVLVITISESRYWAPETGFGWEIGKYNRPSVTSWQLHARVTRQRYEIVVLGTLYLPYIIVVYL